MNQKDLKALSALVDRRRTIMALLEEEAAGDGAGLTPEQRRALRQLIEEKSEEFFRLEEAVRRLEDRLDRIESSLGPCEPGTAERVRRLQSEMREVGETVRRLRARFHPLTLGEAHAAALVDPYTDDSAPMAHRVGVPEGDL